MTVLASELAATLAPGMAIPPAFLKLFEWIEAHQLYIDVGGRRVGFLYPDDELQASWNEKERAGGTIVAFSARDRSSLRRWFGHDRPAVLERLCVFASTGGEGSMAALWLDDGGRQRIVHLGSGSGSALVCVLADEPIDFLRLLAIGYDEICWSDEFAAPPNVPSEEADPFVHPNRPFQAWVTTTFSVDISGTALEIVRHPTKMDAPSSADPFYQWVERNSD